MSKNNNLHSAKRDKNDEFYTQISDIEKEMKHYTDHFRDKVVYCNCDDPKVSNFFRYFSENFEALGLKKLITSCYRNNNPEGKTTGLSNKAVWLEYSGDANNKNIQQNDVFDSSMKISPENIEVYEFEGDGDFRNEESIELLKQSDIIVTNPPFSLFREYMAQLFEHDKKFLVLGSLNGLSYKEIFPYVKANELWTGNNNGAMSFQVSDKTVVEKSVYVNKDGMKLQKFGNIVWYTNLDTPKRHEKLTLSKKFDPAAYPTYDNYDAINVDKVKDIPADYNGVVGVPITFIDKYNPEQFEIVRFRKGDDNKDLRVDGKDKYSRILIRVKKKSNLS